MQESGVVLGDPMPKLGAAETNMELMEQSEEVRESVHCHRQAAPRLRVFRDPCPGVARTKDKPGCHVREEETFKIVKTFYLFRNLYKILINFLRLWVFPIPITPPLSFGSHLSENQLLDKVLTSISWLFTFLEKRAVGLASGSPDFSPKPKFRSQNSWAAAVVSVCILGHSQLTGSRSGR